MGGKFFSDSFQVMLNIFLKYKKFLTVNGTYFSLGSNTIHAMF